MTDLTRLTDAEIAAVAGGAATQTVSVAVTGQSTSNVTTSATATNAGGVTATTVRSLITAAEARANHVNIAEVRRFHVFAALHAVHFGWC